MKGSKSFLGAGWSFPVTLSGGKVELASDELKVRQSIQLILGTSPGERVMEPEFGSRIWELVFAPQSPATFSLASFHVKQALERWEPRVEVEDVRASMDPKRPGVMLIAIDYLVRSKNQRGNLVYPFYLNQK
ncbi:GPW/gp25 family protein [Sorangium sp. So ce381]|uniref:GPW/gp25 family protein n=1 Tax=unclassified Sorangium TaxID=2621164 RepID=UPI003F5AEE50